MLQTITAQKICALIKSELRLAQLPMNETFHALGLNSTQLTRIQVRLAKTFNRSVPLVLFKDTVYDLENKLNKKNQF